MKIKTVIIACLWLSYANGLATSYKIFVGSNSSKYLFSQEISEVEHKPRINFSGGLGISFCLKKKISIEVNALYNIGGAKTQIAFSPELKLAGIYQNVNFMIPIIIKYKFLPLSTPYLGIGPEFGYILSHDLEIPELEEKHSVLNNTHRLNCGIMMVAGYEYKIKTLLLFAELRFNHGFTNFLKDESATVKSETWAFYLGLEVKKHAD